MRGPERWSLLLGLALSASAQAQGAAEGRQELAPPRALEAAPVDALRAAVVTRPAFQPRRTGGQSMRLQVLRAPNGQT
jgi:hypothetical protein